MRHVYSDGVEQPVARQPQPAVVAVTEAHRGFDDLVENRLQPATARDRAQHVADCALLRAKARYLVGAHAAGSSGPIVRPKPLSFSQ